MNSADDIREAMRYMTPSERARFIAIMAKYRPAPDFLDRSFPEQRTFIEDEARLKALLCTRRAGKSFGVGIDHLETMLKYPGDSSAYIGLTRESATRIIWKDVLKVLLEDAGIKYEFNRTALSLTIENGSVLYIVGADASDKEMRKIFGQKFRKVSIDEAALYMIDLRQLVYSVLQPAMADLGGTINLVGMPSDLRRGLFYDLTNGLIPSQPGQATRVDLEAGAEWSVHCWSGWQNPHMRERFRQETEEKLAINPRIAETPMFRREWLGEWVTDDTKLVYRFDRLRNTFAGDLPTYARGAWHYVLGCDLGYVDATALCLWAYHDHDPVAYCLKAGKRKELDVTSVAAWAKEFARGYRIDHWIIDGANKQAVEEMRKRHHIPWAAADKTGKSDFIELMNSDLILGNIRIHARDAAELATEYGGLIWEDVKAVPRVEHPECDNHCTDASLYAWRKLYAFRSKAPEKPPGPGTEEWLRAEEERLFEAERQRAEERQRQLRGESNPWEMNEEIW